MVQWEAVLNRAFPMPPLDLREGILSMTSNRMRSFLIALLAVLAAGGIRAEQRIIDGVAVIVNDAVITYQDVRSLVGPAMDALERQFGNQPQVLRQRQAELFAEGTEQLVERQLILHDFKTSGYNLPESVIDDAIKERIRQRYGDRATLAKTLREEGMTFETYRQRTREEIIVEQMRYFHVSKEIVISPQKIADFYEANRTNYAVADQVKLRMIVLNKPVDGNGDATRDLANEILAKIKEGATFEEMARIYSEGSQRTSGGDWGWVERSVLRKELAEVAFGLEKGQQSGVIELPEACFIMRVEDRRPAHIRPLSAVRNDIERNLLVKERARLHKKWIDKLRAKAFVRYY